MPIRISATPITEPRTAPRILTGKGVPVLLEVPVSVDIVSDVGVVVAEAVGSEADGEGPSPSILDLFWAKIEVEFTHLLSRALNIQSTSL